MVQIDLPVESAVRIRYPTLTKKLRKRSTLVIIVGLLLLCIITSTHISHKFSGSDIPKCRSIYMYPSYARIDGFDSRHTKLAKKYHLYLYREQGKDKEPKHGDEIQLDGIPVLFIPGNAGSFKQARSIAAASANLYFEHKSTIQNFNAKNMDYFTADFNEDFTAFHGQTMLDQAVYLNDAVRYILSLYAQSAAYKESNRPLPKSVILLGHSMGGIVARLMLTLPNHIPESVNTILTLSSPHSTAPVTFDGDILKLYDRVNSFWTSAMNDMGSYFRNNVSVISITGGILDDILPADYTNLKGIVPESNGFTTFTTTIPELWTPIDHLAIVWCDQLRYLLAKYILEIVNDDAEGKTVTLDIRMHKGRKFFLSGLERITDADKLIDKNLSAPAVDFSDADNVPENHLLVLNSSESMSTGYVFNISKSVDYCFEMLTSLVQFDIFFCKDIYGKDCIDGFSSFSKVPHSTSLQKFPTDSSWGESVSPFRFISLNGSLLQGFQIIVFRGSMKTKEDFVLAKYTKDKNIETASDGLWKLSLFPFKMSLKHQHSFVHGLAFPNLWSSLISFNLKTTFSDEVDSLFRPMMRQYVNNPYETKWHLLAASSSHEINMHNISPFIPLDDTIDKSLNLMFFIPPGEEISLRLAINWKLTLKMLYIRFRLAFASIPISIIALVLCYQFYYYDSPDSKFISFDTGLMNVLNNHSLLLFVFLSVGPIAINHKAILTLLHYLDPVSLSKPSSDSHMLNNNYMLGLRETFVWWIGPVFFIISVALLFIISRLINAIEFGVIKISSPITRYTRITFPDPLNDMTHHKLLFNNRQLLGVCFISLGVMFYVPYQFAFILVSLIQMWNCMKLAVFTNRNNAKYSNIHNYNVSFLMLTIFMIPINAPIVVVFLRNFAIRWETAFRSHHNFLAIAPTLLLTLRNSQCNIPIIKNRMNWLIVVSILGYLSFYSFMYGIRNLYWVYHISNILNGVLFFLTIL
ncbi:Bst1 [Kluyveromyces lactis]|nr:Bst1 [Kluyveromyces lactis]